MHTSYLDGLTGEREALHCRAVGKVGEYGCFSRSTQWEEVASGSAMEGASRTRGLGAERGGVGIWFPVSFKNHNDAGIPYSGRQARVKSTITKLMTGTPHISHISGTSRKDKVKKN